MRAPLIPLLLLAGSVQAATTQPVDPNASTPKLMDVAPQADGTALLTMSDRTTRRTGMFAATVSYALQRVTVTGNNQTVQLDGTKAGAMVAPDVPGAIYSGLVLVLPDTLQDGKVFRTSAQGALLNATVRQSDGTVIAANGSPLPGDSGFYVFDASVGRWVIFSRPYLDSRARAAAPVQSVQGRAGDVLLTRSDLDAAFGQALTLPNLAGAQPARAVLAAPAGASGLPGFRGLTEADVPPLPIGRAYVAGVAATGLKYWLGTVTTAADGSYAADTSVAGFVATPQCWPNALAAAAGALNGLTATPLASSTSTSCRGFVTRPAGVTVVGIAVLGTPAAAAGVTVQILATGP